MNVHFLARQIGRLPQQSRVLLRTCIYGLVAGVAAVAFQLCIHWFYDATYVRLAEKGSKIDFLVGTFLIIMSTSMLAGWLLTKFCKEAAGSGIPQLKLAFWKDFGHVPWRVVWVKFVAGFITIGGGASMGREGPSVQLAGGLSSNVAGMLGEPKQKRRGAAVCGAAAGLAAAFNTPLAAITFVLEEIIADLNSRYLGAVLLASVIGALVVHGIIGKQPAFILGDVAAPHWQAYLLMPVVSAVAALMGVIFQKSSLKLRMNCRTSRVPVWLQPAAGAFVTWVIGCAIWWYTGHLGVFGVGYEDLTAGLNHNLAWQVAGLLLVGKLTATIFCYGMGGCGGIFSPTLFFGGMTGILISGLCGQFIHLEPTDVVVLAVVGMSATLGGVVRAPVTGILIAFEMTHEFAVVPALMLGALISEAISRKMTKHNFYEALLEQDGHNLEHVIPPRDLNSWQQLPVSSIANFQPVIVKGATPENIKEILDKHPYNYFPVVEDKQLKGILSRQKGDAAVKSGQSPVLQPAVTCTPNQSVRQLQYLLIESPTGVAILLDKPGGRVIGLVTLHDLLRAEVAVAQQQGKD